MAAAIDANTIISLLRGHIESVKNVGLEENDSLIASGLIESFDFINFLSVLESAFTIKLAIDMLDIENFETPSSIAEMVNRIKNTAT